ncbi:hypothetical protein [Leptospira idonii]|uniref:Uncharacterized protein n=1 Tax=Leptospira idonii TaxID=1193500 RepID=A0A4R9M4I6_9LEPT|nr:hypothetical protein [Leptospira idonii]TGN20755.1 hypothetical protein EHS15_02540 [Leptospira idonii]
MESHSRYELIFRKITKKPRFYFGFAFLFANALGCYLEWKRNVPILFYLDFTMCLVSVVLILLSGGRERRTHIFLYLFFLTVGIVLEIETQIFDPVGEFDNVRVGYAVYLVLMLSVFLFPGKPYQFFLFWVGIYLYSFIRYTFLGPLDNIISRFIVMSTYGIPTYIFAILTFNWWYKLNLQNVTQKQKILMLQAKLVQQERTSIYSDMHNYLGAGLTQLMLAVDKIPIGEVVSSEKKEELKNTALFLISSLQSGISVKEDVQNLSGDFLLGMKSILIRRYSISGRKLKFRFPESLERFSLKGKEKQFLSLLTEITNNDLKYGFGDPVWEILEEGDKVCFNFDSKTTRHESLGRGRKLIEDSILALHAKGFQFSEEGEKIRFCFALEKGSSF